VEKELSGDVDVDLPELASALFDMRKQLMEGIEAQKTLGIMYSNEEMIKEKTNEMTDRVLIKLIKQEYKAGKTTTARLAQVLRRLVPEADELKRLLPKIKDALLEEGMPLDEYLNLMQELGRELQSQGLAKILEESSEEIGIDGEELIQEIKGNPVPAAELIHLAAEIRKETEDKEVLTDLLGDYVERLGSKMTLDTDRDNVVEGEQHLQHVVSDVKSNFVKYLGKMDIKDDVLAQLEGKLNQKMDELLDNLRIEWIRSQSNSSEKAPSKQLTVLQTLERGVSENEELGQILKIIRSKVESQKIDENDFKQIYNEIIKQKQKKKSQQAKKKPPPGVLTSQNLLTIIEKEIARAKRYHTPFAALGFSLVKAKLKTQAPSVAVTHQDLKDAILLKLTESLRDADLVGQLGKTKVVALLLMTHQGAARVALRRIMKSLHLEPIEVKGALFDIKVAGVIIDVDPEQISDAKAFVEVLSRLLMDMATRIKNIHSL
jgi:hypothetical protein